jgi:hypothetical protein
LKQRNKSLIEIFKEAETASPGGQFKASQFLDFTNGTFWGGAKSTLVCTDSAFQQTYVTFRTFVSKHPTIQEIRHSNLSQLQEYLAVDPADSHRAIMSLKY